jgi:hypothetical protein
MEKGLDSLGRPPTEAGRLLRIVFDALGEAEAASIGGDSSAGHDLAAAAAATMRDRTVELAAALAAGGEPSGGTAVGGTPIGGDD